MSELFHVRITDRHGLHFIATLPSEFANEHTRIHPFHKGIVVRTPGQPPVYINGTTRQISRNPEVCRTDLIEDPRFVTVGRQFDKKRIAQATQIYGADPRRSH